jgi:hypothetical protein
MGISVGKYKHYKGTVYTVIAVGTCTETEHDMAIYIEENDLDEEHWKIWVRPASMFFETVDNDEGLRVLRFERVEE